MSVIRLGAGRAAAAPRCMACFIVAIDEDLSNRLTKATLKMIERARAGIDARLATAEITRAVSQAAEADGVLPPGFGSRQRRGGDGL